MANESLKKELLGRAGKVKSSKVRKYVKEGLLKKIDQSGDYAGIWLEKLESDFGKLKPEGMMEGFEKSDFADLYFVITGVKAAREASIVERVVAGMGLQREG